MGCDIVQAEWGDLRLYDSHQRHAAHRKHENGSPHMQVPLGMKRTSGGRNQYANNTFISFDVCRTTRNMDNDH